VRERQGELGTLGFRELYDLWVECGEQVYAQVAHSAAYCQLQAQLGNATMQLRARQQKLIEHALKQFDLPTRSELNSVHRLLREQARQLRELQAQLAAVQAGSVNATRPAARARGKGKTSRVTS
jgi:class III poly(R)-hydroxyalkanoic acid synthase PhaE subunit